MHSSVTRLLRCVLQSYTGTTLCYFMIRCAALVYATLRYAVLRHATLYTAALCWAALRYATLLCYDMLCYATLCFATLRSAMLREAKQETLRDAGDAHRRHARFWVRAISFFIAQGRSPRPPRRLLHV